MKVSALHPVKKILVPTDFSKESGETIAYAANLASRIDSKIILYHAVHMPVLNPNEFAVAYSQEDLEQDSLAQLDALRDDIIENTGFTQIDIVAEGGMAISQICSYVRNHEIDLVIMGSHGAHGLGGLLMGCNTSDLIAKCSCPVLAVPYGIPFEIPEKILFATNYADNDFQSIYLLTQYFKVFRPEIVIAHVEAKGNHSLEDKMMVWFREQVQRNIPYDRIRFILLPAENAVDALESHLETEHYSLMATSMRSRNLFDYLTSRSLTKSMVKHTAIPLLAFHAVKASGTPLF